MWRLCNPRNAYILHLFPSITLPCDVSVILVVLIFCIFFHLLPHHVTSVIILSLIFHIFFHLISHEVLYKQILKPTHWLHTSTFIYTPAKFLNKPNPKHSHSQLNLYFFSVLLGNLHTCALFSIVTESLQTNFKAQPVTLLSIYFMGWVFFK